MARAHEFQRRLETGEARNRADLARQFTMSRARITQIMKLLDLPPEAIAAAMSGHGAKSERALRPVLRTWSADGPDEPQR